MLDYNVPGGKLNRGLSVIDSYSLLNDGRELTSEEIFQASALGWCIEWLQAYFLVLDDIMDNSHTRRGQPCWYKLPKVGMIAVNDGILLRNHITRILKNHFRAKPYYVDLLDLFNEVEFQTASGQMIDLITTLVGEKDLSKYSLPIHRRIVQYKTAYIKHQGTTIADVTIANPYDVRKCKTRIVNAISASDPQKSQMRLIPHKYEDPLHRNCK
nr:farnesyl pyrophosphate synthase-like [Nicotiana tomentosiformis]